MSDENTPAPSQTPVEKKPNAKGSSNERERSAIRVAIWSVGIFLLTNLVLFFFADTTNEIWTRWLFLYNGIQAVAFAGAGFLFGKEVNRGRAEAAENTADQERQRADEAQEGAASGKAMAAQIKEKARVAANAAGSRTSGEDDPSFANVGARGAAPKGTPTGSKAADGGVDHLQELAGVAERLFPKA